jgi:tetratricopeptide (TPR) repeat protein
MRRLVRRILLTASAMVLGVVLFLVDSIVLGGPEDHPPPRSAPGGTVAAAAPRGSLAELQGRLERTPGDWRAWSALGVAYLEQASRSGDPSTYPQAQAALTESLRLHPQANVRALRGQASLATARADFVAAARLGAEITAITPVDPDALGLLTDALVECGRYAEAEVAVARMVELSPDSAALARVSSLRALHGDTTGALEAMERAWAEASSPGTAAHTSFRLGELAFASGDLATAQARFVQSRLRAPGYPLAVAGSAKVAAARGDAEAAVAGYRRVLDDMPLPRYAAELGDVLASLGRAAEAAEQYAWVAAQSRLIQANGGRAGPDAALFAADHGHPVAALELAAREHAVRESIHTDDALAWALHRNGRNTEALVHADRSLRLGTRDASLHYHRGMIESALGRDEQARASLQTALEINPYFSLLQASTARAELARLGGALRGGGQVIAGAGTG